MSSCIEVKPSEIQKELDRLEETHKENKQQRACLFNLIVYAFKPKRPQVFRELSDQIASQFPCRILFIEEDPDSNAKAIKTSICVKQISSDQEKQIICEEINLFVPASIQEQSYPLILPHLVPDLPILLIWGDDPTKDHPLFSKFQQLAHRLIFESECTPNLQNFCATLKEHILKHHWEVADLNWVRGESWRKALVGIFNTKAQIEELRSLTEMTLKFAGVNQEVFCQNHYELHYLHGWIAAQLGWIPTSFKMESNVRKIGYKTSNREIYIRIEEDPLHKESEEGSLTFFQIKTASQKKYTAYLNTTDSLIKIEIVDEKKPNETYNTYLMHAKWKHSLSKEICYHETSSHYCNMLSILSQIQGLV
jgi:glucose-6-phosphate dehydrogenase assembly protein OpcA